MIISLIFYLMIYLMVYAMLDMMEYSGNVNIYSSENREMILEWSLLDSKQTTTLLTVDANVNRFFQTVRGHLHTQRRLSIPPLDSYAFSQVPKQFFDTQRWSEQ